MRTGFWLPVLLSMTGCSSQAAPVSPAPAQATPAPPVASSSASAPAEDPCEVMRAHARSNALPVDFTGCADPKGDHWLMSHECAEPASRHFQVKAMAGTATQDDLKMLRRACKYVGDQACMQCAEKMMGSQTRLPLQSTSF